MHTVIRKPTLPAATSEGIPQGGRNDVGKGMSLQKRIGVQRQARRGRASNQTHREITEKINRPLSEIALERSDIPAFDPAKFACRSIEERHRTIKKGDRIRRPLNAFMLYRKTYQEVAKSLCTKTNHQQISTICGRSWRDLEPLRIRKKFEQLAQVEKRKHIEAHPGYKYIPISNKKAKLEDGVEMNANGDVTDGNDYIDERSGSTQSGQHMNTTAASQRELEGSMLYDGHIWGPPPRFILGEQGYLGEDNRLMPWSPHVSGNQYAYSQSPYSAAGFGHLHEPSFAGIPSISAGSMDPAAVAKNTQPMNSGYDPLLSGSAGPLSPFSGGAATAYPPLDAQSGWQPQLVLGSGGQWNAWGAHDDYLGNQDEWQVEDLEPSQFDQYFRQMDDDDI